MDFHDFASSTISRKDFEFLGNISSHSFGSTERAKNIKDGKEYALKSYQKSLLSSPEVLSRAIREKEALTSLKSSGILQLFGTFVDIDNIYLVLESYPNGTLNQFMKRFAKFPFELARFFGGELMNILGVLRNSGFIHSEINPSCLVVSSDFHLKLSGFQEALRPGERPKKNIESAEFLAPEVLNGEALFASDLWSVGCIIFLMLVEKSPFSASNNAGMIERIKNGVIDFPGILPPFAIDLIQSILLNDPAIRLGVNSQQDLESHIFFQGLEIETIYRNPAPDYKHEMAKESEAKSRVIYEGIVKKKAGWIYKRRLLIISDEPRISYYEPTRRELRGEIAISSALKGEVKNKIDFHIITPKRTYYFKVINDTPDKWVKAVAELVQKLYGRS
jgi:3-phosphoinositide dependent protein kinase-1